MAKRAVVEHDGDVDVEGGVKVFVTNLRLCCWGWPTAGSDSGKSSVTASSTMAAKSCKIEVNCLSKKKNQHFRKTYMVN